MENIKNKYSAVIFASLCMSITFILWIYLTESGKIFLEFYEPYESEESVIDKEIISILKKNILSKDETSIKQPTDTIVLQKDINKKLNELFTNKSNIQTNYKKNKTNIITSLTILVVFFSMFSLLSIYYFKLTSKNKNESDEYSHLNTSKNSEINFIEWVENNDFIKNKLFGRELEKVNILKEIYEKTKNTEIENKETTLTLIENYIELNKQTEDPNEIKNEEIFELFENTQHRLNHECRKLNSQADINLYLSFFISFFLLIYLFYTSTIYHEKTQSISLSNFLYIYFPRVITTISSITIFLYFTRMYKTNILDVKYYQNELTNLELKFCALKIAINNNEKESIREITQNFLSVERNSIMNKDQTTLNLERVKFENEFSKDLLNKMWDLLNTNNKKD